MNKNVFNGKFDGYNLLKYNLVSIEKSIILYDTIKHYKIGDPSHKNIMIEGVCHFQYPEQLIIEI
jgi:hypothetical protein